LGYEKNGSKKRADPVDVLFISRNRKIKIKTADGHLEGDYIFYSIMDKLSREYPNIKHSIFIWMIYTRDTTTQIYLI